MPDTAGSRIEEDGSRGGIALQSSIHPPVVGTLLAFDFGTQRIGVATGNTFSASAQPLSTIDEEKNVLRFAAIAALVKAWQPVALVVGLPANDDGSPHALTALCRRFAQRLHGRHGLLTLLVDERYSSLAASEQLYRQGIRGRQQKSLIDQYAAQQILQSYLDAPSVCEIVNADRGYSNE
ncbi:MAG: Holliday junction DNA helicase RuvA [Gallionellales bacterium RIFOXYB12_FULL_54_9]|nr:MAG: Holliday junction DNA helicase RuvA [Gallionellales bacterium RIFOXYB12_FULL_54_9]